MLLRLPSGLSYRSQLSLSAHAMVSKWTMLKACLLKGFEWAFHMLCRWFIYMLLYTLVWFYATFRWPLFLWTKPNPQSPIWCWIQAEAAVPIHCPCDQGEIWMEKITSNTKPPVIFQGAISKTWTAIETPQLGQMSQRILSPDMLYTVYMYIYR